MNYGRGFPLPQYGNRDSWTPPKPIPPENGIGQNRGSLTAAALGGPIPQGSGSLGETPGRPIPVDDVIICGKESALWRMTPVRSIPMGNGIVGHRDSCTTTHQENGIVQNGENWNPVMSRNSFSQGNGGTSWTPVTPGKPVPQRSNFVTVDKPENQVENENWEDLVGIYQDLLQEETLNWNKAAQDLYPTQPPSAAQNIVNQVLVASSSNRNSNPILNSRTGPNPSPIRNPDRYSNQASTSLSCFRSDDPANWNCNLLAALVSPKNRNENLVGIYQDLLQEETLNWNKAAQDLCPTQTPSAAQNIVNQVLVASSANRNSNPILNSRTDPNPSPIPNPNRYSNQASTSLSCFRSDDPANWNCNLLAALVSPKNRNSDPMLNSRPGPKPNRYSNQASTSLSRFRSDDPANWNCNLLAAIVRPKKSSASFPSLNGAQNNSVHALNRTHAPNSSTQVGSNSTGPSGVGSMVGNQQSHTFASNKPMGGYNSKQLPMDGFPIPYRPCYNLNSPPRSELDAASSGITRPLPFSPIIPDTRQKHTDGQWVPAKNRHESQRNEDADNHNNELLLTIGNSTSSAVSTTQKEHLVSEEGDELGIDLNKTP